MLELEKKIIYRIPYYDFITLIIRETRDPYVLSIKSCIEQGTDISYLEPNMEKIKKINFNSLNDIDVRESVKTLIKVADFEDVKMIFDAINDILEKLEGNPYVRRI